MIQKGEFQIPCIQDIIDGLIFAYLQNISLQINETNQNIQKY